MVCIVCGGKGALLDTLCSNCWGIRPTLLRLPAKVRAVTCAHCGSVQEESATWGPPGDPVETIRRRVRDALEVVEQGRFEGRVVPVVEDEHTTRYEAEGHVVVGPFRYPAAASTRAHWLRGSCRTCSRRSGSYYEATLQLRSAARNIDARELEALRLRIGALIDDMEHRDPQSSLSRVDDVQGGLDLVFGTMAAGREVARMIQREFGATIQETSSQAGRKDGRDLLRITLAVRLPAERPGDVVRYGGHEGPIGRITARTADSATVEDLADRRRHRVAGRDLERITLLAAAHELRRAVVVTRSPGEVQVLDPDSYRTVELALPPGTQVRGSEALVVRVEDTLLFVDDAGDGAGKESPRARRSATRSGPRGPRGSARRSPARSRSGD